MRSRPLASWFSASLLVMLAAASPAVATPPSLDHAGALVVPVEFADQRFRVSEAVLRGSLEEQVSGVRRYYARLLGPDSGLAEIDQETLSVAFPLLAQGVVAPVIRLPRKRSWFGRDRLDLSLSAAGRPSLRWWRDAGHAGEAWDGQRLFRRQVIGALEARGDHPRRYAALVLVSAGRSAFPGSSQLWPSAQRGGELAQGHGLEETATVIVAQGSPLSVWVHEIGHCLGLPDLYLDLGRRPRVDAGPLTAMAAGAGPGRDPVALTAIERAWLVDKAQSSVLRAPTLARLASGAGGSTLLVARTAVAPAERPRALLVASADGSPGGWLVEVFDRRGLDVALPVAPRPALVVGRVLYRGLLGLRGGPRPLDPTVAGVMVSRVDSFDLAGLRTFAPRGPGLLVGEILPASVSNRVPGLSRVFLAGDVHSAPDGTRILVRSLQRATGERPTEAEVVVQRGNPLPAGRAQRVARLRRLRERVLQRFRTLVDQP